MNIQFFIKVENIITPLKTYQVIEFSPDSDKISPIELINKIMDHYNLKSNNRIRLELWSGSICASQRVRLDNLEYIPDKYRNIWVRGYIVDENLTNYQNNVSAIKKLTETPEV
jgi:hypothetical protein